MLTASRSLFAALCLSLATLAGCTGSPASPSEAGGATIAGTVTDSSQSAGLTVAVVGTSLSANVEPSGRFQIDGVPPGDVQLRFKDSATEATARVANVTRNEFIELQVQISGRTASILNESRSNGKVSLCHREGNGGYHLIDVSVNAEPAHRGHGDARTGEPVPGTQRQVFNLNCVPTGPAVNIEKFTNGEDADNVPGPSILVGSPVIWRYEVTNTGTTGLTSVAVVDDRGVVVNCAGQSILAAGQAMTCTGTGVATPGQYSNIGTVTANSTLGAVSDSDPSHYLGVSAITPQPTSEITICHIPPGNFGARHTISIGTSAWPAHQGHCANGTCDYLGPCQ